MRKYMKLPGDREFAKIVRIKFAFLITFFSIILTISSYFFINQGHFSYRVNRVLLGLFSGFIFAYSGSMLQSSLRNPLADPYLLGIGGGALLSIYVYYLVAPTPSVLHVPLVASIGGLSALFLTILIAEAVGGSDVAYVLSGIGISSFFSGVAITLYYFILSRAPHTPYIYAMLIGSLVDATKWKVDFLLPLTLALIFLYFLTAKPLNALIIGDEYASQLGFNAKYVRLITAVIAGVSSSIAVSAIGIIGFIGLVSPHIARLLLRTSDNRFVIPLASLTGALVLSLSDIAAKTFLSWSVGEVPAGVIASVFGAPLYVMLILRGYKWR
ncbi:MAG: iron ABC transporter permease [Desulfurococcaceae archaeon]